MKNIIKSLVVCFLTVGIFNLSTASTLASEQSPTASISEKSASPAPKVVSAGKPLSAQQLSSYQQQASAADAPANKQAAGAGSNTAVWVVVGIVVVVGVVALASGGGGGGGGGY